MGVDGPGRMYVANTSFFLSPDSEDLTVGLGGTPQWGPILGLVVDAPGFIQVRTGLDLGSVNVEVRARQTSDPQDCEGVEEVSVFLRQQLRAESVSDEWLDDTWAEPRFIVTAPGMHRVRLSCRGRLDDFQEWVYPPEHEPVESFLVEVWPAPHSPRADVPRRRPGVSW